MLTFACCLSHQCMFPLSQTLSALRVSCRVPTESSHSRTKLLPGPPTAPPTVPPRSPLTARAVAPAVVPRSCPVSPANPPTKVRIFASCGVFFWLCGVSYWLSASWRCKLVHGRGRTDARQLAAPQMRKCRLTNFPAPPDDAKRAARLRQRLRQRRGEAEPSSG